MKDSKEALIGTATGLMGILIVLAIIIGVGQIKIMGTDRYEGYNTISVTGTAEATAVPDVARFTYSIESKKKTVAEAQAEVTSKSDALLAKLKAAGIEEKDIKTDSYSSYPEYDYVQASRELCIDFCPPGKQVLTGYRVSHSVTVTVRDMDKVGTITQTLGTAGVQNLYGPNFEIDDLDTVKAKARAEAIVEAKEKAQVLAKDLGVKLGRLVSFSDPEDSIYPMYEGDISYRAVKNESMAAGAPAPTLPVGENEVVVKVMLMYRVR